MSTGGGSDGELLASGNPIRPRGLVPIVGGLGTAIFAMAAPVPPMVMLVVALFGTAMATWGVLDLLGSFDDPPAATARLADLVAPLAVTVTAALACWLALRAAVAGSLSPVGAALCVPGTMIAGMIGVFRLLERLGPFARDEQGCRRPLLRRHGFWLLMIAVVVHVPLLGSHALTDPWETHYGEVSREILARGDWISLWWAEDGWFQSKPVLTFWLQAASMAFLGVRYEPGRMLSAVAEGGTPHPEWALRMPSMLFMLVGLYVLYRGMARTCGRRAAFLGGVVLLTMPQFFLVSRQAMTDMPFVAGMMGVVGCVLSAAHVEPERRAWSFAILARSGRGIRVSLFHLVIGAALFVMLLQIGYLFSRNVAITTTPYFGLTFVNDTFLHGSPGNCGSPGNAACVSGLVPQQDRIQPALQALLWLQATALLMWLTWGERRVKRLIFLAAWMFAALASMSKGIGGVALPIVGVVAWVVATGRWRELTRMEIVGGLILFAIMVVPWFAASYVRHGWTFIERLFFDHMVKRTFGEMHQTNKGDDISFRYYVWQLGYASFPWCGLAPVGLVSWLRHARESKRWSAACLLACVFLVGFLLFSLMGTKFHHYALPLLPPLAMLTGILLDDMLGRDAEQGPDRVPWGGVAIGAALTTVVVGIDLGWTAPHRLSAVRLVQLFSYRYSRAWPEHLNFDAPFMWFTAIAALSMLAMMWRRRRGWAVGGLVCVALGFALWTVDVYMPAVAPHWGQRELLVRYEQERRVSPGTIVAYQMNWKGENFYRGNAIAAFKTTGAPFRTWVDETLARGESTFYFLTEHKRIPDLKAELGTSKLGSALELDKLTDKELNNKFALLRVKISSP